MLPTLNAYGFVDTCSVSCRSRSLRERMVTECQLAYAPYFSKLQFRTASCVTKYSRRVVQKYLEIPLRLFFESL